MAQAERCWQAAVVVVGEGGEGRGGFESKVVRCGSEGAGERKKVGSGRGEDRNGRGGTVGKVEYRGER